MRDQFSVCAAELFFCNKVGEMHSCVGIDIQSARPAPVGKLFGVDEGAHNDMAASSKLALSLFGFTEPYIESVGELVAIGHDPEDGAVIFGEIPGNSCSSYGLMDV